MSRTHWGSKAPSRTSISGMMRNGPPPPRIRGRPEEVDEHGVPLGDGDGASGGVEGPARTSRVDDLLAPGVPRHDGQGEARDLLLADPEHQRQAAHHAVPGRRHVHDTLVETGVPDGGGGPGEPFELLRDAGAGIEGPRSLCDHRSDHVARAPRAPSPARRLRREDRRRARPARSAWARRRAPRRARARRAIGATPPPVRSAAAETLRAPLVDAHDHRRGRRPDRSGEQEEVDGARARGREHVEEERGGEHDGDRDREENRS